MASLKLTLVALLAFTLLMSVSSDSSSSSSSSSEEESDDESEDESGRENEEESEGENETESEGDENEKESEGENQESEGEGPEAEANREENGESEVQNKEAEGENEKESNGEEHEGAENEGVENENEESYYTACRNNSCLTAVICGGQTDIINCTAPQTIEVHLATYGRQGKTFCWSAEMEETNQNVNCTINITSLVADRCEERSTCSIPAFNSTLPFDPCQGTEKYIWIGYKCV